MQERRGHCLLLYARGHHNSPEQSWHLKSPADHGDDHDESIHTNDDYDATAAGDNHYETIHTNDDYDKSAASDNHYETIHNYDETNLNDDDATSGDDHDTPSATTGNHHHIASQKVCHLVPWLSGSGSRVEARSNCDDANPNQDLKPRDLTSANPGGSES